jgi:hypothetical protein
MSSLIHRLLNNLAAPGVPQQTPVNAALFFEQGTGQYGTVPELGVDFVKGMVEPFAFTGIRL